MNIFDFTKKGKKTLEKLPNHVKQRIVEKLIELKGHPDIFSALVTIQELTPATHRLRVGEYRLLLELRSANCTDNTFLVLKCGHRKDIYR